MKRYLNLGFMICLVLLFISCKDTHEKAQDFVDDYNETAPTLKSSNLQSTIAELKADNTIHIIMVSTMEQSEDNKEVIGQVLPTIMAEVLKKLPTSQELVNEGVKFKIDYRASDNTMLATTTIDKATLKTSADNDTKELKFGTSDRKAVEMLEMVNATLPIIDKEAGTTIRKIDIIGDDLVYFVDVDDELKEVLKDPEAVEIMKDEIRRNPQIKGLLQSGKGYGVKKVRFKYTGHDKKTAAEILLNIDDML